MNSFVKCLPNWIKYAIQLHCFNINVKNYAYVDGVTNILKHKVADYNFICSVLFQFNIF